MGKKQILESILSDVTNPKKKKSTKKGGSKNGGQRKRNNNASEGSPDGAGSKSDSDNSETEAE